MTDGHHSRGFHGPKCWLVTAIAGALIGTLLAFVAPARYDQTGHEPPAATSDAHQEPAAEQPDLDAALSAPEEQQVILQEAPEEAAEHATEHAEDHGPAPIIPLWLVIPFVLLLASIALMPFINSHFWHQHFPDFAFFLGALAAAYYLVAFREPGYAHGLSYGQYTMLHTLLEYYAFIALVGGLYIVSGAIHVDVSGRGRPAANVALFAVGSILANLVGTTGASMLLIRPFMRFNRGRLHPIHIVMFIFVVSNCAGSLTPIGDPPLYLGFIKGVPFFWTLQHLWYDWLFTVGALLAVFYVIDRRIGPAPESEDLAPAGTPVRLRVHGALGLVCLALMLLGVFLDPILHQVAGIEGYPIGATFQVLVALTAYFLAPKSIHEANDFNLFPVKEVGLLFLGIFATMAPALGYLAAHGAQLGISSPTMFYFGTGSLSAVLDNAPTYLNFLQIAFGNPEINPAAAHGVTEINAATMRDFLATDAGRWTLNAISTGAVFFGAMTYIGNGPNFMVKAIAESSGVKMPSFFGYFARACAILLPILVLHWLLFIKLLPALL